MFPSHESSPVAASTPSNVLPVQSGWDGGIDDVAFGCECANPSLQIDSWGLEAAELAPAGGVSA